MRLVQIDWEDSFGCSTDWEPMDSIKPEVPICHSVGWLLYDGDDCKVIVPHVAPDPGSSSYKKGQGCGDMTIPTRAVVSITDLQGVGAVDSKAQDVV